MKGPFVIVGDTLLDRDLDGVVSRLAPDAPVPVVDQSRDATRPGGAGLAALLSVRDGNETVLITALGNDEAGAEAARLLTDAGVTLIDLGTTSPTPEKIRIRAGGRALVRLDRGGVEKGDIGPIGDDAARAIRRARGVLMSDYGRGISEASDVVDVLHRVVSRVPVVWDPHPRGPAPLAGATLATPNLGEAARATPDLAGDGPGPVGERARALRHRWSVAGVAITMGERGAVFVDGRAHPLVVPAPMVTAADPCGAGDRFAVSVATGLCTGRLPSEAVIDAVSDAARFVAMGGAGSVDPRDNSIDGAERQSDAVQLAASTRRGGGTVVATGGCFDLIHPGHIAMLEAARRLGDCLIVCLNSDSSVSRIKGPGRPLNDCASRAAVLRGLSSVDGVEVFDGTTPHEPLRRLRPHIWAKGGDYGSTPLPEASLVGSWGGEVVILPYLRDHSTTRIIERAGLGEP